MYKLIRPLLFTQDPETVHLRALSFLRLLAKLPGVQSFYSVNSPVLEQKVFGIEFKNPVGAAAGFDKPGASLKGLQALGFGFAEVGTVSRLPQDGNPKPRLFRLTEDEALINRMGFNSLGAEALAKQLSSYKNLNLPIGISIGKTKIVPLEQAAQDYSGSFSTLYNSGDYFALNVSSPNTPELRKLQDKERLTEILKVLNQFRDSEAKRKPILVKIAPELSLEAIDEVLEVCREQRVDGIIAVNTTTARAALKSRLQEAGGLSGRPLKDQATQIIRHIHKHMPSLPIVGVGGIFSAQDAYEKIKAGASLVQLYTGIIYEGPGLVKRINQGLMKLLQGDGFKNISETVGIEAK